MQSGSRGKSVASRGRSRISFETNAPPAGHSRALGLAASYPSASSANIPPLCSAFTPPPFRSSALDVQVSLRKSRGGWVSVAGGKEGKRLTRRQVCCPSVHEGRPGRFRGVAEGTRESRVLPGDTGDTRAYIVRGRQPLWRTTMRR